VLPQHHRVDADPIEGRVQQPVEIDDRMQPPLAGLGVGADLHRAGGGAYGAGDLEGAGGVEAVRDVHHQGGIEHQPRAARLHLAIPDVELDAGPAALSVDAHAELVAHPILDPEDTSGLDPAVPVDLQVGQG